MWVYEGPVRRMGTFRDAGCLEMNRTGRESHSDARMCTVTSPSRHLHRTCTCHDTENWNLFLETWL